MLTAHCDTTANTRIQPPALVHTGVEAKYAYCNFNCIIISYIILVVIIDVGIVIFIIILN